MKQFMLFLKRTASLLIIAGIVTVAAPGRAHAQSLSLDLANLVPGIADWLTNVVGTAEEVFQGLQPALNMAAYAVGQATSQKLTDKITNSLNGGASGIDGELGFVQDFGAHFQNVAFQEKSKYINDVLGNTSNPFASQIESGLTSALSSGGSSALDNFSLGTTLGIDMSNPANVDQAALQQKLTEFSNDATVGGYSGLFSLGFPENTPIGSRIIAEEELANKIANAKETAKVELTSSGYLPKKTCEQGPPLNFELDGEGEDIIDIETPPGDCEINSPSSFVDESGKTTITSVLDRLANVDSFGELLSSTLSQLAGSLITKGLSSIGGNDLASSANIQYGGLYDVRTAEQNQTNFPSVIVDFSKELEPTLSYTQSEIDWLQKTINALKNKENLRIPHDLDTCTPGPDRGWENRFDKYFAKQTKKIMEKATKDEDATDEQGALDYIQPKYRRSLEEARSVVQDTSFNIPGVAETATVLEGYSQKAASFQKTMTLLVERKSSLNTLQSILSTIKANPAYAGLVLSTDDWNRLDAAAKSVIYTESLATFNYSDTPDDETMKKRVITYHWDKWEQLSNETEQGKKTKRDLFLKFNEARPKASSEISVSRAEALYNSIYEDQENMKELLGQCLLVRRLFGILPSASAPAPYFEQTPGYQPATQMTAYNPAAAIRVSDFATAKSLALQLRNANRATMSGDQIGVLSQQFANLFPDLRDYITLILAQPSILQNELTPETLIDMNQNLFGDFLRVPGAKTIGQILVEDAYGVLFCKLPQVFDTGSGNYYDYDDRYNGVVGEQSIDCTPTQIPNFVQIQANVPDPIAAQNITTYRNNFLEWTGVWYFSSGLDNYVQFDSSSSAGQINL